MNKPSIVLSFSALCLLALASACSQAKPSTAATDGILKPPSGGLSLGGDEALPPEQAFGFDAIVSDANTLLLRFTPANGYYLYQDRATFSASNGVTLGKPQWPEGKTHDDPHFGVVTVYFNQIEVPMGTARPSGDERDFTLNVSFQGCKTAGICYPPMERSITLQLPQSDAFLSTEALTKQNTQAASTPTTPRPTKAESGLPFTSVKSIEDISAALSKAKANGQSVMLDFYADWCAPCLEMQAKTFNQPDVHQALNGWVLLKADVTANDDTDEALLEHFGLIGPPAVLFFPQAGDEAKTQRLEGFEDSQTFIKRIQATK